MFERHEPKVDNLHQRPDGPILRNGRPVRALELLPRVAALHDGHGRQEDEQVRRRKHKLVDPYARRDLHVRSPGEDDPPLHEAVERRRAGAEDRWESNAGISAQVRQGTESVVMLEVGVCAPPP